MSGLESESESEGDPDPEPEPESDPESESSDPAESPVEPPSDPPSEPRTPLISSPTELPLPAAATVGIPPNEQTTRRASSTATGRRIVFFDMDNEVLSVEVTGLMRYYLKFVSQCIRGCISKGGCL